MSSILGVQDQEWRLPSLWVSFCILYIQEQNHWILPFIELKLQVKLCYFLCLQPYSGCITSAAIYVFYGACRKHTLLWQDDPQQHQPCGINAKLHLKHCRRTGGAIFQNFDFLKNKRPSSSVYLMLGLPSCLLHLSTVQQQIFLNPRTRHKCHTIFSSQLRKQMALPWKQ